MYLQDYLNNLNSDKIVLYVDMDGVIVDYDVGNPTDYDKKRPLYSSIAKLEKISKMPNVELFILSVCRMSKGIEEKNIWLNRYASFFKKENRIILDREGNDFKHSKELKLEYIKREKNNTNTVVLIDDDVQILDEIKRNVKNIILLKDTALVD